jgi:hypothetical protein
VGLLTTPVFVLLNAGAGRLGVDLGAVVVGPCEPAPVVGLLTTLVFVLLNAGAGRLGADLGAGAALTCGAGLGGGALVFFWSPQASAEKISRTKSTVEFFRILLFGMFNLLTNFYSSESFFCDFTGQNVIELEIP